LSHRWTQMKHRSPIFSLSASRVAVSEAGWGEGRPALHSRSGDGGGEVSRER
jgi:hypothetical protein